jgi:hypothetical protein
MGATAVGCEEEEKRSDMGNWDETGLRQLL